mmetsp:Transcript_6959/g.6924  ORF Transcript_6959/g.6924 Transcript_6959/m.6924 type:complete len:200 (-) Transcript_6959:184-783(-)
MNRFFNQKVIPQFALRLSKRSYSTAFSISARPISSIYFSVAAATLVSAIAWTSLDTIDNEVDKKKIEEGKAIAEHTGSNQKVDEAKKQAVGRGKVSTKVPPEENAPETKSEIESNQEAEQTKSSLAGSKNEKPQKGSNDPEVKWDNKILKPISSGACGGQFKDVFSALLSDSDLKGSDTIKKLEELRGCLKDHSEILKD